MIEWSRLSHTVARLRAGNVRFTLGTSHPGCALNGDVDLQPYAVVVAYINARVPVEAVLGQGVGAICVVRSAGHVLDRAVMGSVEFAVTDLQVSLVVVLGHDDCRAVADEAVRTGRRPAGARQFQIARSLPRCRPRDRSTTASTRSRTATSTGRWQADYLKEALTARRIDVVGGIYRLESGHIEML